MRITRKLSFYYQKQYADFQTLYFENTSKMEVEKT